LKRCKLSPQEARRLVLASQGLLSRKPFGMGASGVRKAVNRLGYIQIDPISVIRRAHHHTLWTRVPDYHSDFLQRLQDKRQIFEYWSHAAAYLPIEDYPFTRVMKAEFRDRGGHWFKQDRSLMNHILQRLQNEGPLMSKDFEKGPSSGGVWMAQPVRRAFHELFMAGEITVIGRQGVQKLFDLTERVIPRAIASIPTPDRPCFARHLLHRFITAHGLASAREVAYLRRGWKPDLERAVAEGMSTGGLVEVQVNDDVFVTREEVLDTIPARVSKSLVSFISPFDNAIIQRARLEKLFGFRYQTEIYLPKDKRVHGYFSLPILWGDQFVGRMDPKADRATKTLRVQNLSFESGCEKNEAFANALKKSLWDFAAFNGCEFIGVSGNPQLEKEIARN